MTTNSASRTDEVEGSEKSVAKHDRDAISERCRKRIGDVAQIMLDYCEHNQTYQTDKIMTVPAASYTDAAV